MAMFFTQHYNIGHSLFGKRLVTDPLFGVRPLVDVIIIYFGEIVTKLQRFTCSHLKLPSMCHFVQRQYVSLQEWSPVLCELIAHHESFHSQIERRSVLYYSIS